MHSPDTEATHQLQHEHRHGLAHDLRALDATMLKRRRALAWIAGAGASALPLIGCGGSSADTGTSSASTAASDTSTSTTTGTTTTTTASSSCSVIPTETNGPFPADGTTSLNALLLSGIVRSDIRSSFAGATAVAAGVPLSVTLALVNASAGASASCAGLAGYAIYIWHCDQSGGYSLYSSGIAGENYLRGVQATDASGLVTFTTIFPACYSGRWPHIHVEVYPSVALATSVSHVVKTTQIAMPQDACDAVFASTGYSASIGNFKSISLATDNVFSDGATLETPTITGSVAEGYALGLKIGMAA
jgi:protocatechuate 3,4-dioxygenase beta subunit